MQLQRLKLVNFRQHEETELILGPGITAVVGPNGSGKTTLLEGIAWALYGNPAARGSRDSIRRHRAPARSQVRAEVDFALGAHEFSVVRSLYGAELFQDGQAAPIANSQQEVTGRVTRLLGMTRDEFFNTYFTGQKELAVMGVLGPADRARFLSRVLGYQKLKLAQDKLRERRSRLRGELAGLEQGLGDLAGLTRERELADQRVAEAARRVEAAVERAAEVNRLLGEKGPAWTAMVELRESVLSMESELKVAERDVGEARREFERLDRELAEALDAKMQLEKLAPDLDGVGPLVEELERLERESEAAGKRRALSGQLREVEGQRDRVGNRLRELGDSAAAVEVARTGLDAAREEQRRAEEEEEKAHTAWIRDKQDAETKRQSLRDQYRDLQASRDGIVEAGPEGTCPTCARPLGDEYQNVLRALERQLEEIAIDGKYFKQRVTQLSEEPEELRQARQQTADATRKSEAAVEELARCERQMHERRQTEADLAQLEARLAQFGEELAALPDAYDAGRHDAVRTRLRVLEPVRKQGVELQVKAAHAEQLVSQAEAAEKRLSGLEARCESLRRTLVDLGFSEERFDGARSEYQAAEAAVRDAELELASVRGDRRTAEAVKAQVEERLREREERATRVACLKADLLLHDEADRGLHDLRLELNATMRPEISERASSFLADLTDDRYSELELDEQYRPLIIEDGISKSVISGGEEDLVNLVLRLAISQMVAERAGQPLSLLVLDEIFGSLDEGKRHHVVGLLRRLASRFPQVVLITHIESVREGVDRVLRVEYHPNEGAALVTESDGAVSA